MGHQIKELADESGIIAICAIKIIPLRSSKAKLPGNEISVPAIPTVTSLKEDVSELLESGRLTMGEPCSAYTVVKSAVHDGKLESIASQIYGRKMPLFEIRQRLLKKHEHFMRLSSDEKIDYVFRRTQIKI